MKPSTAMLPTAAMVAASQAVLSRPWNSRDGRSNAPRASQNRPATPTRTVASSYSSPLVSENTAPASSSAIAVQNAPSRLRHRPEPTSISNRPTRLAAKWENSMTATGALSDRMCRR